MRPKGNDTDEEEEIWKKESSAGFCKQKEILKILEDEPSSIMEIFYLQDWW